MLKDLNEHYFYFKKSQRIALMVLCTAIVVVAAIPYAYDYFYLSKRPVEKIDEQQLALLAQLQQDTFSKYNRYASDNDGYKNYSRPNYEKTEMKYRLFDFDPNVISKERWMELGVKEKTADGILNYISKGGKFRQADDINKIWGISEEHKARLLPFIKIAETYSAAKTYPDKPWPTRPAYVPKKIEPLNINTADSLQWASLPGIGAGYARRIVKFRDQLGGFYDVKQIAETYGFPDSTFQKILPYLRCNPTDVVKMNINTAMEEQLKKHPKIKWQLAKLIVAYRTQHGPYKNIEALSNIMVVTPQMMQELRNYLKVE